MDKKIILAVAGSGKTTYIVNSLNQTRRSLVLTYTDGNYFNLLHKIREKFNGLIPNNITVMKYFGFLFSFCYKPLLSDEMKIRGIYYKPNNDKYASSENDDFFLEKNRMVYSNRFAYLFERKKIEKNIITRLERYFDELIIDEIQDIAGRDFNFLIHLSQANVEMKFVGDFYQHTFDTSRDGNVNGHLFDTIEGYTKRFTDNGFACDTSILSKSWRCTPNICKFISDNLGVQIESNIENNIFDVIYIDNNEKIKQIMLDKNIIKLHYQKSNIYGNNHKNWGETKGEDEYNSVCVLLNKTTMEAYKKHHLASIAPSTRNKLYVAISRAHANVYLIDEKYANQFNNIKTEE